MRSRRFRRSQPTTNSAAAVSPAPAAAQLRSQHKRDQHRCLNREISRLLMPPQPLRQRKLDENVPAEDHTLRRHGEPVSPTLLACHPNVNLILQARIQVLSNREVCRIFKLFGHNTAHIVYSRMAFLPLEFKLRITIWAVIEWIIIRSAQGFE